MTTLIFAIVLLHVHVILSIRHLHVCEGLTAIHMFQHLLVQEDNAPRDGDDESDDGNAAWV